MKRLLKILSILFIIIGCQCNYSCTRVWDNPYDELGNAKSTSGSTTNEVQKLVDLLEQNNYINSFPYMIKASDVYTNLMSTADQQVIDIRATEDYSAGHIEGSINLQVADVLSYYEGNNLQYIEKVVLVCYSGQTSSWVTALLHTMGYSNTYALKWGMCSWNTATSSYWTTNLSNAYAAQLTTEVTQKNAAGDLPTINTGKSSAEEILRARVDAIFAEGFTESKINANSVFDNVNNYYIINYWDESDYNWGHIPTAIQYTPKTSLTTDTYLNTLPTNEPIVVYGYTGQVSAFVVAYLRVLGYDAKSIIYGVNAMAYDNLTMLKFSDAEIHDYPLVSE